MARNPGNPTLLRCSACGSELKFSAEGREMWLMFAVWVAFTYVTVWSATTSLFVGLLACTVLAFPFLWAEGRLRHAYWVWRHPLRCGGGGHPKVAPDGA